MEAQEVFVAAVKKSLSEMTFVDVEPIDSPGSIPRVSHVTHIAYDGPERGEIEMLLPFECKKQFVENIYGDDWERLDPEEIDDCLLEILNVLAGEYLSELYGSDVQRELSLPQLKFDTTMGPPESDTYYFDAEDWVFQINHHHTAAK